MCEHNELVFLGYQQMYDPSKKLALFNCTICKTTLAFTDTNPSTIRNKIFREKESN